MATDEALTREEMDALIRAARASLKDLVGVVNTFDGLPLFTAVIKLEAQFEDMITNEA